MTDREPLKSPTCQDCARPRQSAHAVLDAWDGTCANCGRDGFVSAAADWREVSPTPPMDELELERLAANKARADREMCALDRAKTGHLTTNELAGHYVAVAKATIARDIAFGELRAFTRKAAGLPPDRLP